MYFDEKNNWLNDTGLLEIPSYGLAVVILLYGGRRIPYFGCVWTTLMAIGTLTRDVKQQKLYWIDIPGQCSSVESHCSQFPWCQKANPPLSLSLRSLVSSGPPIEKVFKRFDFQQQLLFRKDVHHIFFWCDLSVRSRALSNRDQNFGDWFGLFCRQVFD